MQTVHNLSQPPKPQTSVPGVQAPTVSDPWLLYAYPWMPFPRRVIIYLRERAIPESQVAIVQVRDPGAGNDVVDTRFPPRPAGSLPILAIPATGDDAPYIYIRQSTAIMYFLEELCTDFKYGFNQPHGSLLGGVTTSDPLSRARIMEVMSLAEECLVAWNSVRIFGTNAGTMSIPQAAKEMLRWIRRALMSIETFFRDRDMSLLHVTIADITLYQFLEFVHDCYGIDMTIGSGELVRDVYGREVREEFPKLVEFYQAFRMRESAVRDVSKGEFPGEVAKKNMSTWAEGVL